MTEPRGCTPTYYQVQACSPTHAMRARTRSARRGGSATSMSTAGRASAPVASPREEWEVLIWDHHPGYIDRATFEANQAQLASNTRPRAHEPGGAVREGAALLQGIAVCGRCGRKLKVRYQGRRGQLSPAYHCPGRETVEGRGRWCVRVGGGEDRRGGGRRAARRAHARRGEGRAAARPSRSSKTTTRRSHSGGCRSSAPATRPSGPSAATARSSPSTGWSPVAWSATGRRRSARSPRPRPSLSCASASAHARSPTRSASSCLRSALTFSGSGRRRPHQTVTASSSSAA